MGEHGFRFLHETLRRIRADFQLFEPYLLTLEILAHPRRGLIHWEIQAYGSEAFRDSVCALLRCHLCLPPDILAMDCAQLEALNRHPTVTRPLRAFFSIAEHLAEYRDADAVPILRAMRDRLKELPLGPHELSGPELDRLLRLLGGGRKAIPQDLSSDGNTEDLRIVFEDGLRVDLCAGVQPGVVQCSDDWSYVKRPVYLESPELEGFIEQQCQLDQ